MADTANITASVYQVKSWLLEEWVGMLCPYPLCSLGDQGADTQMPASLPSEGQA